MGVKNVPLRKPAATMSTVLRTLGNGQRGCSQLSKFDFAGRICVGGTTNPVKTLDA